MLNSKKTLPEYPIARAGYDLFSSSKELTVVMFPFERFSCFAKAVDDLYKSADIPFNLIVVEGGAPDSVRHALEKRQRKHKNITILYSEHPISIGASINLAAPHLKTPYAFMMDNDVRIPRGTLGKLLQDAKEKGCGILYAHSHGENIQNLTVRTSFLISREALTRLGRLDEEASPLTVGIDIRMAAEDLGISICHETAAHVDLNQENILWPVDISFHSFQWDQERVHHAFQCLEEKWGIRLAEQDYALWLERKKKDSEESKHILSFLSGLISRAKLNYDKQHSKDSDPFSLPKAA